MSNLKKLYKKCEKFKIISFDIFDTLLKRDIMNPLDVFKLVEIEFDRDFKLKSDFAKKRKEAENKARKNSVYDEITLDEIYEHIDFSNDEKELLRQHELKTESNILHRNPEIADLFDLCLSKGKIIYIVSDMYLASKFLESILKRENISGYKKVILSCEHHATKRSGKLFKILCEEEQIHPHEILHIGDSIYADFIGAKKAGLHAYHIKRHTKNTLYFARPKKESSLTERCLYSFLNSHLLSMKNRGQKLGYEVLGPIIYGYCVWIHDYVSQFNEKDFFMWFAARDMYLFYEAYKKLFPDAKNYEYIYISRKSLRPLYTVTVEDITKSGDVFARGKYSLRQIVEYMGYNIDNLHIPEYLNLDDKIYDARKLDTYKEVKEILNNSNILEKEKELSERVKKYCADHGLFNKNIVFVDVGWHGTTQHLLDKISGKKILGLYLGCLDSTNEKIGKDNYKAFVFDEDHDCNFMRGIIVFESLILAPHGSTTGYRLEGEKVVPILANPDNRIHFIKNVQQGAKDFITDFSESVLSSASSLDSRTVVKAFEQLVTHPLQEELENIGQLNYENFMQSRMAMPRGLIHYIACPKEFYTDLKYSPWRIGFLYKLFKLRFPYAKVYTLIRGGGA